MDVELRAPGYQQPTKTKGGRGVRYIDDSDLLVGNVAALALDDCDEANEDDNESSQADEEEFEDHQIKEVSGESGSDTSSEGIDGGKNENVSKSESLAAQSKARVCLLTSRFNHFTGDHCPFNFTMLIIWGIHERPVWRWLDASGRLTLL